MNYQGVVLPFRQFRVSHWIWITLAAMVALEYGAARSAGLNIHVLSPVQFIAVMAACTAIALGYRHIHRDDTMRLFANVLSQFICASFAMAVAVDLGAWLDFPLRDETLIACDGALGFSWHRYAAWMDTQPLLADACTFAYQVFTLLIVVLVCALFVRRHAAHAQRFLIAFFVAGMLTAVLSALFPAVGAFIYYNTDMHAFAHLHPAAGRSHEAELLALRSHRAKTILFPGAGIVTFPSFHCAGAVLLIYASLPMRCLRLFLLPVIVAMLLSLPTDGGHYLVDIVGGTAVAGLGILAARRILPDSPLTVSGDR